VNVSYVWRDFLIARDFHTIVTAHEFKLQCITMPIKGSSGSQRSAKKFQHFKALGALELV
jgi:hypothetical protein